MERENLMQRFTSSVKSFLVPSFVTNVLSPRRTESQSARIDSRVGHPATAGLSHSVSGQEQTRATTEEPLASRTIDIGSVDRPNAGAAVGGSTSVLWTSVDRGKRHLEASASAIGGSVVGASGSKRLKVSPSSRQSLFYPGRVAYGGSYNQQQQQQQSVRVTPIMWDQRRVQRTQRDQSAAAASVADNQLVTPTAKKILDALDRLSTPLSDARRMPLASDMSMQQQQSRTVHYSPYRVAYRRRQAQVPNRSLGVVRHLQESRQPADSMSALAAAPRLIASGVANPTSAATVAEASAPARLTPSTPPQFEFAAPIQRGPRRHSPTSTPSPFTFSRPEPAASAPQKQPIASLPPDDSFVPKLKPPPVEKQPEISGGSFKDALSAMAKSSEAESDGDVQWRCDTCSCLSPASAHACIVCQTKKPSADSSASAQATTTTTKAAERGGSSDEWTKRSSATYNSTNSTSAAAATVSTTSLATTSGNDSEWRCDTCACTSPASAQACVVCQEKRPAAAASGAQPTLPKRASFLDNGPATTPIFSMFSQQKKRQCERCQAELDVSGRCAACDPAKAKWQCGTCLVENISAVTRCVCCDSAKPGALPKAPTAASAAESAPKVSFGVTGGSVNSSAPKATFGVVGSVDSAPKVSFGVTGSSVDSSAPKATFGVVGSVDSSAPKATFGVVGSVDSSAPKATFGAPAVSGGVSLPKINFGVPTSLKESSSSSSQANESGAASKPPTFGFASTDSTSTGVAGGLKFGSGQSGLSTLKFGDSAASSTTSKLTFGAAASSSEPANSKLKSGLSAGANSFELSTAKPAFGADSELPTPAFSFGAKAPATSGFGAESSAPTASIFGANPNAGSQAAANSDFAFGVSNNSQQQPSSNFTFGANSSTSTLSTPSIVFGGPATSAPAPISNSAAASLPFGANSAQKSMFQSQPSSNFNFGAGPAAASSATEPQAQAPAFAFGQNSAQFASAQTLFGASAGFSSGNQQKRPADQQPPQSQAKLTSAGSGLFVGSAQSSFMSNNNAFGSSSDNQPQVDLDAGKPAAFNFGSQQAAAGATFVFGGNRQQQQQPALNQAAAPNDSNPFNPQSAVASVARSGGPSRPRLTGRRRVNR